MSQNLHPEISSHHRGMQLIDWGKWGRGGEDVEEEALGLCVGPSAGPASGLHLLCRGGSHLTMYLSSSL